MTGKILLDSKTATCYCLDMVMSVKHNNREKRCRNCNKSILVKSLFTYKKGKKKLKKYFCCSRLCTMKFFGRTTTKKIGEIMICKDMSGNKRKYVYLPGHPNGSRLANARWIMEKHLRRFLKPNEQVHHMNRNTLDDRVENLRVHSSKSEHAKSHALNKSQDFFSDSQDILNMLYEIFGTEYYLTEDMPNIFNGKEITLPSINFSYNPPDLGHTVNCLIPSRFYLKRKV